MSDDIPASAAILHDADCRWYLNNATGPCTCKPAMCKPALCEHGSMACPDCDDITDYLNNEDRAADDLMLYQPMTEGRAGSDG